MVAVKGLNYCFTTMGAIPKTFFAQYGPGCISTSKTELHGIIDEIKWLHRFPHYLILSWSTFQILMIVKKTPVKMVVFVWMDFTHSTVNVMLDLQESNVKEVLVSRISFIHFLYFIEKYILPFSVEPPRINFMSKLFTLV